MAGWSSRQELFLTRRYAERTARRSSAEAFVNMGAPPWMAYVRAAPRAAQLGGLPPAPAGRILAALSPGGNVLRQPLAVALIASLCAAPFAAAQSPAVDTDLARGIRQ